jgi:hypothetical protein
LRKNRLGSRKASGSAAINQLPEALLKQPNTTLILNIQNNYNRSNVESARGSKQGIIKANANIDYRKDALTSS